MDISAELSMVTEEGEGREDITGVWVVLVGTAVTVTIVLIIPNPSPKVNGIVLVGSISIVATGLID